LSKKCIEDGFGAGARQSVSCALAVMSISAIHVLDTQGKRLIFKDYRGDIDNKKALEVFVAQLAEEDGIRKPVWEYDGINYITIQHNNIRCM